MAKVTLNTALTQLRGTVDNYVLRQTPHGTVLSRRPDMSKVKWSAAQRARRQHMRDAAAHYREVMSDPRQAARHKARAVRAKIPVSSLIMGEYLRTVAAAKRAK